MYYVIMQDVNDSGDWGAGREVYGNSLYYLLRLSVQLKLFSKIKSLFQKKFF